MISGMRFAPSSFRHLVWADIISLNAMARPVLRLRQPLVLPVRCRTVANVLSMRRVTVTAAGLEVDIRREGIVGVVREMVAPRNLEAAE